MLIKVSLLSAASAAIFCTPVFDDTLAARCEAGETRTRTMSATRTMELVDMTLLFNGEDVSEMMGEVSGTSTDTYSAVVVDTIDTAEDGRATKLTRLYEKVEGSSQMEGGPMGAEGSETSLASELVGESVIFTFDGESDEYTPAFPEGSTADVELLEDLVCDLEFAGLLPTEAVAVEAVWDIELEVFRDVVEPGGEMHLEPADADENQMEDPLADNEVEPTLDGTFKGKLVSIDASEGGKLATIELEFDIESHLDVSEGLEPMTQESEMGEITFLPISIVVDRTAKGKGTLVWNVDRGCLVSFELNADVTEVNKTDVEIEFGDQTMEQSQEMTQEGVIEVSYSIE
jgi:hypothetical protein